MRPNVAAGQPPNQAAYTTVTVGFYYTQAQISR
jgi:hypothetical protein